MAPSKSDKVLADHLKTVPLFANTSARQRRTLAKLGKVLSWKAGSVPIEQGSKGAAFFLLLDGAVEVNRDGTLLARLNDGDFVGEMALLSNEPRNATVSAVADTTVFALGRPALAGALKNDPSMGMALLESMARRQQSMQ